MDVEPRRRKRRWYTRKRLVIPLGLLAVIVLLSNRDGSTPPPARRADRAPVRDGNLEFVVTGVRCGVPQVGTGLITRTAKGQYCLADVRVRNVKDSSRILFESYEKLVDSAGDQHNADISMRVIYGTRRSGTKIEPGQQVRGTMVFDIPRGTRAERLELHDGPASGGVTVRLR